MSLQQRNSVRKSFQRWQLLSSEKQRQLVANYARLRSLPTTLQLQVQKKHQWFQNLPDTEQNTMREGWQSLSPAQREELRDRLSNMTPEQQGQLMNQQLGTIPNN